MPDSVSFVIYPQIDEEFDFPPEVRTALMDSPEFQSAFANDNAPFRAVMSKRLAPSPVNIVFLGSSSTSGTGATTTENRYVNKFMKYLRAAYPLATGDHPSGVLSLAAAVASPPSGAGIFGINAAISGSRSGNQNGATPYINPTSRGQIAALQPRIIQHMIGANDFGNGVPVSVYRDNLISEITLLDAAISTPHLHMLVHSYPRFDSAALAAHVDDWSEFLQALYDVREAVNSPVSIVDTSREWAQAGVTGAAGVDPWDYIEADNIHMNDTGHDFMADTLRAKIIGVFVTGTATVVTPPTPPASVTRTLLTTDTFSGSAVATMAGKSTDAALGGSPIAWQSSAFGGWGIDSSNQLARVAGTTEYLGIPAPADLDFEVTIPAMSSAQGTTLNAIDIRRPTLASGGDSVRVRLRQDGSLTLAQLVAGTETVVSNGNLAAGTVSPGGVLRIRALGTAVTIFLNDVIILSATVTVNTAGFVGFTKSSSITAATYDNLKLWSTAVG